MTDSNSKRYYWIKLKTDFFDHDAIDFLMSQKNGCEYIVLYQMLCLKTANNSGEMYSKVGEMIVPYDVNKIVRDTKYFDFDTVTVALQLFKRLGLVYEEENNTLKIANFDELVGSESTWAEKKRLYRDKQKALPDGGQSRGQIEDNVREEIEKEKDIEIDIEIEREKVNYTAVVDLYNETCVSFPAVRAISDARKKAIKARLKAYTLDDFRLLFEKAEASTFLKGGNSRNWTANFDWLIKDSNMAKVLDGNYDDKKTAQPMNKAAQSLESAYGMINDWLGEE